MRYLTHRQREVAMWLLVVLLFTADLVGLFALPMAEDVAQVSQR